MANQELIVMPQRELLPPAEDWRIMTQMADAFAKSGYLKGVTTGFAAVTIMQKGRELGIPPMAALSSIYIVQGKASCSAELMRALILRDQGDDALDIVEMSAKQCVIKYKRRGWKEYRECVYTMDDAKLAKLWDTSDPWKKTPDLMMLARCTTKVARAAFPDVIGGMYEIEEAENITLPESPVRIVEQPAEPLQLNARNADTVTGEIAAKAPPADESVSAPAGWVRRLKDLSNELYNLDDTADSVEIPATLTVAEAKALKANLQRAIDETRQALASTDASLEGIGV